MNYKHKAAILANLCCLFLSKQQGHFIKHPVLWAIDRQTGSYSVKRVFLSQPAEEQVVLYVLRSLESQRTLL